MRRGALAPAKINLFLHVGAPDQAGFHPLCSLMAFADIGDVVTLREGATTALQVTGPFAGSLSDPADNLVARAASSLCEALGRPPSGHGLMLDKRLPVASGLGGGSSDAGAAFRLLREAIAPEVSDLALERLAAALGSDGAACLWGRPVIAEGRGERLSPAPGLPPLDVVLVNPGVPVSTASVYGRFDAFGHFNSVTPPTMPERFESAIELAGWLGACRNDLEAAAVAVAPEVGVVLETLSGEGESLLARVSGSGGTCFAICEDDIAAEGLAARLASLEPRWWVRRCRLGGPWDDPN